MQEWRCPEGQNALGRLELPWLQGAALLWLRLEAAEAALQRLGAAVASAWLGAARRGTATA